MKGLVGKQVKNLVNYLDDDCKDMEVLRLIGLENLLLCNDAAAIKEDITELKQDMAGVKKDVASINTNMEVMRTTMEEMKDFLEKLLRNNDEEHTKRSTDYKAPAM